MSPRATLPLLVAAALFTGGATARDFEGCSNALSSPRVVVSAPLPSAKVDRSLPMSSLSRRATGWHDRNTLGLTVYRPEVKVEHLPREKMLSEGLCASRALRVDVVVPEFTIYVAREIPAGSCLDGEILAHEELHVRQASATHQDLVQHVLLAAEAWAGQDAYYGNPQQLRRWLTTQSPPDLGRVASDWLEKRNLKHQEIDTPDEYRRLGRACNGAAGALFLRARSAP